MRTIKTRACYLPYIWRDIAVRKMHYIKYVGCGSIRTPPPLKLKSGGGFGVHSPVPRRRRPEKHARKTHGVRVSAGTAVWWASCQPVRIGFEAGCRGTREHLPCTRFLRHLVWREMAGVYSRLTGSFSFFIPPIYVTLSSRLQPDSLNK